MKYLENDFAIWVRECDSCGFIFARKAFKGDEFHCKCDKFSDKLEIANLIYNNESIIAKLQDLKEKSKLTNAQIAKNSNGELSESTIHRILMGKMKNPSLASVIVLIKSMGFKSTDVFDETIKLDVETEVPQVVVPTIDANVYDQIIKMYKDMIATKDTAYNDMVKRKDNAIKWLFISLIVAVLVAAIFIGIDLASGEFGLFTY